MSSGFLCDARFRGCRLIQGSLTPALLASLADEDLQRDNAKSAKTGQTKILGKMSSGDRCQLNLDDQNLKVCAVKKDEGFESDSESSSSLSSITTSPANAAKDTGQGSQTAKSTFDHVMRLDKLIGADRGIERFESIDSSCSRVESDSAGSDDGCGLSTSLSSSGTESEEEIATGDVQQNGVRSTSNNIVREIESGENFSMKDIIFCHVVPNRPKVLIIVVKNSESSNMNAIIFECISQQAAQGLYSQYYIASNKHKLNRNRFTKRKSPLRISDDEISALSKNHQNENEDKIFPKQRSAKQDSKKKRTVANGPPQIFDEDFHVQQEKLKDGTIDKFEADIRANLKNVNVIEVKDDTYKIRQPTGMMQRVDENGVTHIEIESGPYSMIDSSVGGPNQLVSITQSNDMLSALDRLSIHSYNNPESYLNKIGDSRSCPNSLIQTTKEILDFNERERKSRQRQPPLLIKDANLRKSLPKKETRQRVDRRNRSRSEERKVNMQKLDTPAETDALWSNHSNFHHEHEPVVHQIPRAEQLKSKEGNFQSDMVTPRSLYEGDLRGQERPSRSRASSRSKDVVNRPPSGQNGRKRQAPPPPPRRHPNNPSLLLVPTKSGQEVTRAMYPKESYMIHGNKVVRVEYPMYNSWAINNPEMNRNNNNRQRMHYSQGWMGSYEYHAPRATENHLMPEVRKRSRSKSPSRAASANRYVDLSSFNIQQKFRDLSDSVIQSLKNNVPSSTSSVLNVSRETSGRLSGRKKKKDFDAPPIPMGPAEPLRPVIRKERKVDSCHSDSKRVTFSAYATVQLMDP